MGNSLWWGYPVSCKMCPREASSTPCPHGNARGMHNIKSASRLSKCPLGGGAWPQIQNSCLKQSTLLPNRGLRSQSLRGTPFYLQADKQEVSSSKSPCVPLLVPDAKSPALRGQAAPSQVWAGKAGWGRGGAAGLGPPKAISEAGAYAVCVRAADPGHAPAPHSSKWAWLMTWEESSPCARLREPHWGPAVCGWRIKLCPSILSAVMRESPKLWAGMPASPRHALQTVQRVRCAQPNPRQNQTTCLAVESQLWLALQNKL